MQRQWNGLTAQEQREMTREWPHRVPNIPTSAGHRLYVLWQVHHPALWGPQSHLLSVKVDSYPEIAPK